VRSLGLGEEFGVRKREYISYTSLRKISIFFTKPKDISLSLLGDLCFVELVKVCVIVHVSCKR
jgi:hypothetical protein